MNEDKSSRLPVYIRIRAIIREKIEAGEYAPGTAIPPENVLAAAYEVNRLTVRSAVDALAAEGVLKRVQGKGVFVMPEKIERDLESMGGFTQTMKERQIQPKIKVLTKRLREAGDKYAALFHIDKEALIYYIRRVCFADGEAVSIDEIYVPENILPGLLNVDLSVFSMSEVYGMYGIERERTEQTLDIVHVGRQDARLLGIAPAQAVFLFDYKTYGKNGRIVEFSHSYTRGDQCDFTVHFKK